MSNENMMSAIEALIGKNLGSCTIQSYTGIGRMGIVYLAVQSSPRRDVALKIVPPVAAHTQEERTAFAARFLRAGKALTALQHPHILPVYDFGIGDGMAYLVMPYIRSGTLFDLLNREGVLSPQTAARYLEQMAAALHDAHTLGITHGDVTPSNILLDADRRALVSDFALTSIAIEKPTSQMRLLRSGVRLGSLAYQAPEQIMGESIGPAADIYALSSILFQMLTGQTPFQDSSPIGLATQQVQATPPAPRSLRPELPVAAEQVILRALAKSPADRYASAQDMADAFLAALGRSLPIDRGGGVRADGRAQGLSPHVGPMGMDGRAQGSPPPTTSTPAPTIHERARPRPAPTRLTPPETPPTPRWQEAAQSSSPFTQQQAMPAAIDRRTDAVEDDPSVRRTPLPAMRLRFGRKAHMLRVEEEAAAGEQEKYAENSAAFAPIAPSSPAITDAMPPLLPTESGAIKRSLPSETPSRELPTTNPGTTGTMKLPSTVKIVQVPVVGQPGRYVTGLLPVQADETPDAGDETGVDENSLPVTSYAHAFVAGLKTQATALPPRQKIIAAALVALVIFGSFGALLFARGHSGTTPKPVARSTSGVPNVAATFNAHATATASANSILSDTLSQNIHNWPIAQNGSQLYFFSGGAYHIFDNANGRSAPAFLPGFTLKEPLVYTLRMDEIKGNDGSINNSFGMILFFSTRNKSGHSSVTFYSFEVVNTKGGQYQFWKYDSSSGGSPWISLWHHTFGNEYHQGQGAKYSNTFTVAVSSSNFSFLINGHKVGLVHDSSFNSGEIGMLVNLKGTEVAFSHLQLMYYLQP